MHIPASSAHLPKPLNWLRRAHQHRSRISAIRREIHAEMDAVAAIDVDMPVAVVHDGRPGCSPETVRGLIVSIGLNLHNSDEA